MRKSLSAAVLVLCTVAAMVFLQAAPVSGQAAAPNCPPGQPFGRPPGVPPSDPPANTGRPAYPPGRCQLALSRSAAARGDTFTATGGGFVPGEEVTLSIAGSNVRRVVADANGAFAVELQVPQGAPVGSTEVVASAPSQTLSAAFEVLAPAAAASDPAAQRSGVALSRTGQDVADLAAAGASLVLVGVVIVTIVRRRRNTLGAEALS